MDPIVLTLGTQLLKMGIEMMADSGASTEEQEAAMVRAVERSSAATQDTLDLLARLKEHHARVS